MHTMKIQSYNSNRDRSYPEPGRPAEGEYEADTQDREMSN